MGKSNSIGGSSPSFVQGQEPRIDNTPKPEAHPSKKFGSDEITPRHNGMTVNSMSPNPTKTSENTSAADKNNQVLKKRKAVNPETPEHTTANSAPITQPKESNTATTESQRQPLPKPKNPQTTETPEPENEKAGNNTQPQRVKDLAAEFEKKFATNARPPRSAQMPIAKEKRFSPSQPMKNGEAKGFSRQKKPATAPLPNATPEPPAQPTLTKRLAGTGTLEPPKTTGSPQRLEEPASAPTTKAAPKNPFNPIKKIPEVAITIWNSVKSSIINKFRKAPSPTATGKLNPEPQNEKLPLGKNIVKSLSTLWARFTRWNNSHELKSEQIILLIERKINQLPPNTPIDLIGWLEKWETDPNTTNTLKNLSMTIARMEDKETNSSHKEITKYALKHLSFPEIQIIYESTKEQGINKAGKILFAQHIEEEETLKTFYRNNYNTAYNALLSDIKSGKPGIIRKGPGAPQFKELVKDYKKYSRTNNHDDISKAVPFDISAVDHAHTKIFKEHVKQLKPIDQASYALLKNKFDECKQSKNMEAFKEAVKNAVSKKSEEQKDALIKSAILMHKGVAQFDLRDSQRKEKIAEILRNTHRSYESASDEATKKFPADILGPQGFLVNILQNILSGLPDIEQQKETQFLVMRDRPLRGDGDKLRDDFFYLLMDAIYEMRPSEQA